MSGRIPLPPRVRFEVFKRDKFTCQYCGRRAPEVVLNCDHIVPVAEGGTNDILNLLTSCRDCNGGKGAVPLTDDSALTKQFEVLAELEERRQQIEMMLKWRDELQSVQQDTVGKLATAIGARGGFSLSENGLSTLRKWLKRFSAEEIISAAEAAFDSYLIYDDEKPTLDSWEKAFSKIPAIIRVQKEEVDKPWLKDLFYIQGILRNRSKTRHLNRIEYLEHLHLSGASIEEMTRIAKRTDDFLEFEEIYDAWLTKIGRPF